MTIENKKKEAPSKVQNIKSKSLFKVKIQILPQSDILDPQGQAVERALSSLGYKNVENLKVGKEIVFDIESESKEKANTIVAEMCDKLLANPVIEDYKIEIQ